MSTFEVTQDDGKSTIEELIHKLKISPVEQKCATADSLLYRAEEIIQNESLKNQVSDALEAALSDMGEEKISCGGPIGGITVIFYVREKAVEALAKINPAAAASLALQIIAEITGKPSSMLSGDGFLTENFVTFSEETIAAFRNASTKT
jgi:hypothetical protein